MSLYAHTHTQYFTLEDNNSMKMKSKNEASGEEKTCSEYTTHN